MNLTKKIVGAFIIMIAIALALGVTGYRAAYGIRDKLEETSLAINPVDRALGSMSAAINESVVARRTLISPHVHPEKREQAHAQYARAWEVLAANKEVIDQALARYSNRIEGWAELRRQCDETSPKLEAFAEFGERIEHDFRSWEDSRILNPEALLGELQQFRADHYATLQRLAEAVIAGGGDGGPDLPGDDGRCALGKWIQAFDRQEENYSRNPALRECLERIRGHHRDFHHRAADLQRMLRGDAEPGKRAQGYRAVSAAAGEVLAGLERMAEEAGRALALARRAQFDTLEGIAPLHGAAITALDKLVAYNHRLASDADADHLAEASATMGTMFAMSVAAVLVGLGLAAFLKRSLTRGLTRPLQQAIDTLSEEADRLTETAEQMNHLSDELTEGAAGQASSIEEISSTMEEMASVTRQNADHAQTANGAMRRTVDHIKDGNSAAGDMSDAMREISVASEKIGAIVKTIQSIVFQTNLLALNAAVEAARAGENGKGFAVVADEVRSLAQHSAAAAQDTVELINGTVARVSRGAKAAEDLEAIFSRIADAARDIERQVDEIASASKEQAMGVDQINSAIAQMDQVTQHNAGRAGETHNASTELNGQMETVRSAVHGLATILGTARQAQPGRLLRQGEPEEIEALPVGQPRLRLPYHTGANRG